MKDDECTIDIYDGSDYDPASHFARECFWSDGRFVYWGWLYDKAGKIVGDYTAGSMEAASKALGVKFNAID